MWGNHHHHPHNQRDPASPPPTQQLPADNGITAEANDQQHPQAAAAPRGGLVAVPTAGGTPTTSAAAAAAGYPPHLDPFHHPIHQHPQQHLLASLHSTTTSSPMDHHPQLRMLDAFAPPVDISPIQTTSGSSSGKTLSQPEETVVVPPRGKPQAMAAQVAAARLQALHDEIEQEKKREASSKERQTTAVAPSSPRSKANKSSSSSNNKKKKSNTTTPTNTHKKTSSSSSSSKKKTTSPSLDKKAADQAIQNRTEFMVEETPPPITDDEYLCLQDLMGEFCRAQALLIEFSRPLSLLHPELAAAYSKIIPHPIDLGHICRGIQRREYSSLRDVRLDVWRVFGNCVKFHSHPHNKHAVPTFVSIAIHLRDFFNILWQEYMMPSQLPPNANEIQQRAFDKRERDRTKRNHFIQTLMFGTAFCRRLERKLKEFIRTGKVDRLDEDSLFSAQSLQKDPGLAVVKDNIVKLTQTIHDWHQDESFEIGIDTLRESLRKVYNIDALEGRHELKRKVSARLDRLLYRLSVHIAEASTRGVGQSSIWANIATAVWARESSKKPYWPALCLGILSVEEQRQPWYEALTLRNEERLPEKLRVQLVAARHKCEQAQKKQSTGTNFFLVEFMGTHEFIWIRENDIIEDFDVENDPNLLQINKKKRQGRHGASSIVGTKTYKDGLEECTAAVNEFEVLLADAVEYETDDEGGEEEDQSYSYRALSQPDDEADIESGRGYSVSDWAVTSYDVDEANYLLVHEGAVDIANIGKKPPKKKAVVVKKKPEVSPKVSKAKDAELDKKRKHRTKERAKALKANKKSKTLNTEGEEEENPLVNDKRTRATAIVNAYLGRSALLENFKGFATQSVASLSVSTVDSVGLLGMTLAFRALTGELTMPDDNGEGAKRRRPWEGVDTEASESASERASQLAKQVDILTSEIERVHQEINRRRVLTEETIARRKEMATQVDLNEETARQNFFKKKKKSTPSKPNSVLVEVAMNDADEDVEDGESTGHAPSEDVAMDDAIQEVEVIQS